MKNIKQFNDFAGEDGYLIVDGLSNEVEGGKKKLSDVKNEIISEIPEPPEQVNADWEQNDDTKKDYIKNKPTVEDGAQVNKIESISIDDTKLVIDENKNVNINIDNGGLEFLNGSLEINTGTGGLYVKDGELDVHCKYPIENYSSSDEQDIRLIYDDSTLLTGSNGLEVANPVPDTDDADDGDVLTYSNDEIVWKSIDFPNRIKDCDSSSEGLLYHQSGSNEGYYWLSVGNGFEIDTNGHYGNLNLEVPVPNPNDGNTQAENGSVLTYDANSDEIVWAAPTGLTKDEADTYYAPKSEFDDLVAWLAPISANLVIAASNN